jgi:hypothetical protein
MGVVHLVLCCEYYPEELSQSLADLTRLASLLYRSVLSHTTKLVATSATSTKTSCMFLPRRPTTRY